MILHFRTTKKCNINCIGCSSPYNKEKDFNIEEKNLKKLNNFLRLYNALVKNKYNTLDISYLGGEVLSNNEVKHFKNIDDFFIKNNWNIYSGIQTNLIVEKSKLDDLIKNYKNFSTSYNFDNTRRIKGKSKLFKNKFKENYKYLYEKGIQTPIIVLITNKNVKHMFKIYKVLNNLKINVVFRYFLPIGKGKNLKDLIPNQEVFANNLIKINEDKNKIIKVEPLETMKSIINKTIPHACGFQNNCTECSLSIENNNKIFTCLEIAELNILPISDNLKNINLENLKKLSERKEKLPEECKKCNVFEYCKGGCMAESYMINENLYGKTFMCKSWYILFNYLKKID